MFHQDYKLLGPGQYCHETQALDTEHTKKHTLLLLTSKDMAYFSYVSAYVAHSNLVSLGNLG